MHFVENSNVFSDSLPQGSTNETFQYLFNKYSRRQSDPNPGWRNLELVTILDEATTLNKLNNNNNNFTDKLTYDCHIFACSGFYYIDGRGCIPKFNLQTVVLQPPLPSNVECGILLYIAVYKRETLNWTP